MDGAPARTKSTSPNWSALTASIVAVLLALVLRSAIFGGDFISMTIAIPLLLLSAAIAGVAASITTIRCVWERHFREGTIGAVLTGAIVLAGLFLPTVLQVTDYAGAAVNLAVFQSWYDARLPTKASQPRLVVFERGGMVFGGVAMVYDESDEITLPPDRQTNAFKARAGETELGCGYDARPLWGHYYDTWFGC